jgi:hypothetical protein
MERFIPYHIDVTRIAKAKVRMRKGDGQSYVLESDDGALQVDVADLLRAMPHSEKTAPGTWTTEGADFVLDGEHDAVDTTTAVGATLLAMARFADHKTQHPSDVHHLPSEYDRFYFAEATRMPESSRYHHVFFDFFGRKFQLFDCQESDDSTAFLLPVGEWHESELDRFEVSDARTPPLEACVPAA